MTSIGVSLVSTSKYEVLFGLKLQYGILGKKKEPLLRCVDYHWLSCVPLYDYTIVLLLLVFALLAVEHQRNCNSPICLSKIYGQSVSLFSQSQLGIKWYHLFPFIIPSPICRRTTDLSN